MWWVVSQSECSLAVPKRATLSAAVSECSTEVGRRGPVPCCGCERIDDCSRIVSEKVFGQRHVIRPIAAVLAYGEEVGQLQTGPLAQSDQVDGLAPFRPFLSTPSCCHLANYARQHVGRIFPADDLETLESLIDEIKRVPAIGVRAVSLGGKEEICDCSRRRAAGNGRQHNSFGRIPMPHGHPAP